MADRPKVMFLLFEGLAATVVESQVLANVRLLQVKGVADFEVWAFSCVNELMRSSRRRKESAERLAQAPVRLFRALRPLTFLAYAINVLLITWHLYPRRHEFSHIHARTDYSAAVAAPVARLFGLKLIWDCRGDSVAEVNDRFIDCGGLFSWLVRLRLWELQIYAKIAGRFCHGALFVTDELYHLHRELVASKPVEVVPCAAHEELFFFDPDLRAKTRLRLGYQDGETVYIYSGSLNEYQCFGQTVSHFTDIYQLDPRSRFLVLTPAVEMARYVLKDLPAGSFQVYSCTLQEVNSYLNAADIGFLLRQPIQTNYVASPTKFAEYGLSGLNVITSEAVPWAYRTAKEAGNLVSVVDGLPSQLNFDRSKTATCYRDLVGRESFLGCFRDLYFSEV